jgi:hypothetical protein
MGGKSDKDIVQIAPNFYNIRASFYIKSVVNIGTHMSLIRLESGKFLVVDAAPLEDEIKEQVDALTENGSLIEAVIATHPFHTRSFPAFYDMYPDAPYYGTPRHLSVVPEIPWRGAINENLDRWEPEVYMRIPAGAEFISPMPESTNHFSCVWVYSPSAKTVHVDDTVVYVKGTGVVGVVTKITGKEGKLMFHPSMKDDGLYPTPEAPWEFKAWMENVLQDWDIQNICTAHMGYKIDGAHELLVSTLAEAESTFVKISERNQENYTPVIVE